MSIKARLKLLQKLAQEQPVQQKPTSSAPLNVPEVLFATLSYGYNPATVELIKEIADILNSAAHYASFGKDSFQSFMGNSFSMDGNTAFSQDQKNIRDLSKQLYSTFLNSKNAFKNKVDPNTIDTWCANFINNQGFRGLSQINPSSELATKVNSLNTRLTDLINQIKLQNPK